MLPSRTKISCKGYYPLISFLIYLISFCYKTLDTNNILEKQNNLASNKATTEKLSEQICQIEVAVVQWLGNRLIRRSAHAKQFLDETCSTGNCSKIATHTSMLVREFLAKNKTVIMSQAPYFAGLVRADDTDERSRFSTIREIKAKSKQELC